MKVGSISEEERSEIRAALIQRQKWLNDKIKQLMEGNVPTDHLEERVVLYVGTSENPGLLRLFSTQAELQDQKRTEEPKRAHDGQQDAFGGGAETGGAPVAEKRKRGGGGKKPRKALTAVGADAPEVGAEIHWPAGARTRIEEVIGGTGDGVYEVRDAEDTRVEIDRDPDHGYWRLAGTPVLKDLPDGEVGSKGESPPFRRDGVAKAWENTVMGEVTADEIRSEAVYTPKEGEQIPRDETWSPPEGAPVPETDAERSEAELAGGVVTDETD